MSILRRIRRLVRARQVELSDHALEEMDNDHLSLADVRTALSKGKLWAKHEDDPRGVRYLLRSSIRGETVDVVCRLTPADILWVITVYVTGELENGI